jgi:hypothetical protein
MSGHQAFADALLDAEQAPPAGLKAWNGSDPAHRFNVHRNNMFVSLIEALAATFPVTQALVGVEFFRAMARVHIGQSPPASTLLFEYGRDFPDFIADFSPAEGLPYLADVARLEYLRVDAANAADAVALDADVFRPLLETPGELLALRVQLHPACRVLRSGYAVFSIWAAHQGAMAIESVALDQPEDVLVFRPLHDVRVLALPPGAAAFLGSLSGRHTLADAAMVAQGEPGFDLAANLRALIEQGLVVRLS